MNEVITTAVGQPEILQEVIKNIANHGLNATVEQKRPVKGHARADALMRIGYGAQDGTLYAVEIKRWLTPANEGAVAAQLRDLGPTAMLVTDYVTPQVAERLKAMEIPFADTAGNAYLRGPNFLVWLTGQRQRAKQNPPRAGRAWQPTGLKLIFALICNPDWVALGYRELAARAGVANGTVGWVMRELGDQGFLVQARRRAIPRRLRNRRKLLDRWVEVYTGTYRPTTLLGRYRTETREWWRGLDAAKYGVLIGGEPAADMLTHFLRPEIVTLYARGTVGTLMLDHRLRAVPDGDIEIRQRFWPFDYEWEHQNLTPPALIYADLLATGDARCIDTAKRIFDGYLARFFAED